MTPGAPGPAALTGCTIVVAADRRAGDLASALQRRGAHVLCAPPLSILPNADDAELVSRTRRIVAEPPDVVVVTTGVGFRGWMDAAHEHGLDEQLHAALAGARFIARGPKAHGAIQQSGFTADWVAPTETAAEVGAHLLRTPLTGCRVVVQHHGAGSDGLDALLESQGATVTPIVVYRWAQPRDPELLTQSVQSAAGGEADAVLFTSAPSASAWLRAAADANVVEAVRRRAGSGRLLLAAVGPITAAPLRDAGMAVTVADRGRLGSLARCVVGALGPGGAAPVLRTPAGELSLRSGGAWLEDAFLPLSRAGAALLGALLDAGGRVLSRDELAASLPRAGGNAHAVEMAVARLREALGGADVVRTVVKRGYRLALADD